MFDELAVVVGSVVGAGNKAVEAWQVVALARVDLERFQTVVNAIQGPIMLVAIIATVITTAVYINGIIKRYEQM